MTYKPYILQEEPPALKKVTTKSFVINEVENSVSSDTKKIKIAKENSIKLKNKEDNPFLNPYINGEIMNCCGLRYCYSFDRMKYLPRNPNLVYRSDGTIDFDPYSRRPDFCDYNGAREAIRQAKIKGLDHVHWRTSAAVEEELTKDGYNVMNSDKNDIISWKGKKFPKETKKHKKNGKRYY